MKVGASAERDDVNAAVRSTFIPVSLALSPQEGEEDKEEAPTVWIDVWLGREGGASWTMRERGEKAGA